jgi:uncharacterized protein (TIRG00374 family)
MKGMVNRRILWVVAAVLMAAFLYRGRGDLHQVLNLDPLMVGICFACTVGIAITSAIKWKVALRSLGETGATHFGSLVYYFMCGRAVGLVFPMDASDFGVRTMSLKFDHSMSIGKASYSVYLDRTFDLVIAGVLLIPSILFVTGAISPLTGLILFFVTFTAGLVFFMFFKREAALVLSIIFKFLFKALCKIPWIGKRVEFEAEKKMLEGAEYQSAAPALYALSGLKFVFTAMRFVVIAAAIGMSLKALEVLVFVPSSQFVALFAITPGGLGISDWTWFGLLYRIGAEEKMIVPYLVSVRVVVSLSIVVLAALSRLLYRKPKEVEGKDVAG